MNAQKDIAHIYAHKSAGYKLVKRGFDITCSSVALVLASPIMLATALAIVIDDGHPVFYHAPRKGKDGKSFVMYKFRSMKRGAEEMQNAFAAAAGAGSQDIQGAAFKIKNDERMTRVGRFIRKYFIDELPQFINVVRGEMSLVGPRAIQQTRSYTPYEAQRLVVQPGLTCYWQTSGNMRMPWEEWVELDLKYIEDMSLRTDLSILVKTIGVIARGEGEY